MQCATVPPTYFDATGELVYPFVGSAGETLVALGNGGRALTQQAIVDLGSGEVVEIEGWPEGLAVAARNDAVGGFLVARQEGDDLVQYVVASDGVVTSVGPYSAAPEGYQIYEVTTKLDRTGVAFQLGFVPGIANDVIVRRSVDSDSVIVLDEADDTFIKMHGGALLVTGP